jgi:hypothetical protein
VVGLSRRRDSSGDSGKSKPHVIFSIQSLGAS